MVKQTQHGSQFDGNYSLIALLNKFELVYKIKVNDGNRDACDPYQNIKFKKMM